MSLSSTPSFCLSVNSNFGPLATSTRNLQRLPPRRTSALIFREISSRPLMIDRPSRYRPAPWLVQSPGKAARRGEHPQRSSAPLCGKSPIGDLNFILPRRQRHVRGTPANAKASLPILGGCRVHTAFRLRHHCKSWICGWQEVIFVAIFSGIFCHKGELFAASLVDIFRNWFIG